jgi:hypothetical protein
MIRHVGILAPSSFREKTSVLRCRRENAEPHLELHIVLGPNRADAPVVRLQQLLEYSVQRAGRQLPTVIEAANRPGSAWTKASKKS